MYIVENGMKKSVKDGLTAEEYKSSLPASKQADVVFLKTKDKKLRKLEPNEPIPPESEVTTLPQIKKGSSARLKSEVDLLRQHAKPSRYEVAAGYKTIDAIRYGAVVVKGVSLDSEKFDTSRSRLAEILFLLPPSYPLQPPIGCYLQFPHKTKNESDHHFTMRAHYGAPQLEQEGWYWYCVGIGSNFHLYGNSSSSDVHKVWKPGPSAHDGHNLVTLLNMAIYAINSGD